MGDLDEIIQKVFLNLDPKSLHVSRQVCGQWNKYIKGRVWGSPFGRNQLLKKLKFQWQNGTPREQLLRSQLEYENKETELIQISEEGENDYKDKPFYVAGDDEILVCGFYDGKAKVYNLNQSSLEPPPILAVLDCSKVEAEHNYNPVQLDVGKDIIVTVDVVGMVTIWKRKDFTPVYQIPHHGENEVLGIKMVGNQILTGGNDGKVALLKYEDEKVKMIRQMTDKEKNKINHLDSDGVWALTGHNRTAKLWNVEEGELVSIVRAGYVCCCALSYPYAATTGMTYNMGVGLWDMIKGTCVRRINPQLSMWVVQVRGDYLAMSMAKGEDDTSPITFIYKLTELTNTKVPAEKMWNRQIACQANQPYDSPHMFLNKTSLFVTEEKFIKSFNFWNC